MNLKNRFSNDSITVKTVTDDFGRTEDVETIFLSFKHNIPDWKTHLVHL